jgi:hypothetical protein
MSVAYKLLTPYRFEHADFEWIPSLRVSLALGDGLSRLVHQRAARKPIIDARTVTYMILSTGFFTVRLIIVRWSPRSCSTASVPA